MPAVSLSLPSLKGGECAHNMPNSVDGDGTLGANETASEVGNGISAMLALSEQVINTTAVLLVVLCVVSLGSRS